MIQFFFLFLLPFQLSAYCFNNFYTLPCSCEPISWCTGWGGEVRGAYFYPSSEKERKIWNSHHYDFEVEIDKDLWAGWQLFGNLSWIHLHGKSHYHKEDSRLILHPLSLGIKYFFPVNRCVDYYIGAGPNYTWMREHRRIHHSKIDTRRQRFGATLKTGFCVHFAEIFFVDIFADYLFIPMDIKKIYDVGGFRTGVGIGFQL